MNIGEVLDDVWAYPVETLDQTLSLRKNITWKPAGNPVTQAVFLHKRLICEFLRARIAGVQMVSKESYTPGMALESQRVTILDPIDGTDNFCSGILEWGTTLPVWHERTHSGRALGEEEHSWPLRAIIFERNHTMKKTNRSSIFFYFDKNTI